MARIDKIEQARREGMSYALRIAKEHGIEYLEDDLKMRGAINLPIPVNKSAMELCVRNIKDNLLDTVLILSSATLHDEFGFGQKRVNQFIERFNLKAECLEGGYCTWKDYVNILQDECNITLGIRSNDKDVKIDA